MIKNRKIGLQLSILMINQNEEDTYSVLIKLIDNLDMEEKVYFRNIIEQKLSKENYKYYKYSKQFSCDLTSEKIIEISKLPFIKSISLQPKFEPQEIKNK